MPALTAEAGSDAASGAARAGELDDAVLHRRRHAHAEQPHAEHGDGGDHRVARRSRNIASSDAVTPIVPTTRARRALASANRPPARRADRGGDAVGEQVDADERPGDAGHLVEERHQIGERRLDGDEDHGAQRQQREHPGRERGARLPERAARPTAGTDGTTMTATTSTTSRHRDDGGERAAPADGLTEQGAQRQAEGARAWRIPR